MCTVNELAAEMREVWRRSPRRAVVPGLVAGGLVGACYLLYRYGYESFVEFVAGVRHRDEFLVVVARSPLSLFAPAPNLPVWGAVAQVVALTAVGATVLGWRRVVVVAVAVQTGINVILQVVAGVGFGSLVGLNTAGLAELDTGPSAAVIALVVVIAMARRAPWLMFLVVTIATAEVLVAPNLAGCEHVIALGAGWVSWWVIRALDGRPSESVSSRTRFESPVRWLHAMQARRVAAGTVALSGVVVMSWTWPGQRAEEVGAGLWDSVAGFMTGPGAAAVVGVALVLLARGLLRGQRRAWTFTILVASGVALLHALDGNARVAALAVATLFMLIGVRHSFPAGVDAKAARRALATMLKGFAAVFAAAVLTIEAWTRHASNRPRLSVIPAMQTVLSALHRANNLPLPNGAGGTLHLLVFGAAAVISLVALRRSLRPVSETDSARAGTASETQVSSIVHSHGTGTLDYFALRDDKTWFVHGNTLIAYAVRFGVCLVSPDPIGPEHERLDAFTQFRNYVDSNGWGLAVLAASESNLSLYRSFGMRSMYIGDEAIVDVHSFTLDGGERKSLRQAVNRIARHGYTVSFHDPLDLDPRTRSQLMQLMAKSRKGGVERGFSMTLGRLFDRRDTGLLLAVCTDNVGDPVAFCQFVPSSAINGWSLDLMRRDPAGHPNGLLDFVLVETIHYLAAHGYSRLGLNFTAMRTVLIESTDDHLWRRAQRAALIKLSDDVQIASLWKFNNKYGPVWQPRYAVLDGLENALNTGLAIAAMESLLELPIIGRIVSVRGG